jgi:GNAT superfamily N-acetyltransferase
MSLVILNKLCKRKIAVSDPLFSSFCSLFTSLFPTWKIPTHDHLKDIIDAKNSSITVYHNEGKVSAFYITKIHALNDEIAIDSFTLLSYLAVDKKYQRLGIGSKILQEIKDDHQHEALLLETQVSQTKLYTKNNFVKLPFSYDAPCYGNNLFEPMTLMSLDNSYIHPIKSIMISSIVNKIHPIEPEVQSFISIGY